jgi:hypothetical protein
MSDLTETGTCLLFAGCEEKGAQTGLRQKGRIRHWLMLDVKLIEAKNGPWVGAAMPGSPNGCGIFAAAESREFLARCDADCIYLSATLDQLLRANGIREIVLVGEAPAAFVDGMHIFAVAHGYEFRPVGPTRERHRTLRPLCRGCLISPAVSRRKTWHCCSFDFQTRLLRRVEQVCGSLSPDGSVRVDRHCSGSIA